MATQQSTFPYNDTEKRSVKKSQLSNPLLVRRPVGEVKPSSYSLPGPDFTYGQAYQRDPEGAAELTTYWQFHQPTADPRTGQVFLKNLDFQVDNGTRFGTQRVEPSATIRFGRPNVASTPAELLTSAQFQREYLAERERAADEFSRSKRISKFISPRPTLASTGHHKIAVEERRELWKMQQFRDVPSRVSSASSRYAAPAIRPTYSYDAGRFPLVRAGMPQGLGAHQYPELPSAMPLRPTSRIYGLTTSTRDLMATQQYEEQKESASPADVPAGVAAPVSSY